MEIAILQMLCYLCQPQKYDGPYSVVFLIMMPQLLFSCDLHVVDKVTDMRIF